MKVFSILINSFLKPEKKKKMHAGGTMGITKEQTLALSLRWFSGPFLSLVTSPSTCYIPAARETSPLMASGNVNG